MAEKVGLSSASQPCLLLSSKLELANKFEQPDKLVWVGSAIFKLDQALETERLKRKQVW